MQFLLAFLVGGCLCALAQLIIDATPLTPAHTMVLYVVSGAVLGGLGVYEALVRVAGAGASMLVSNFGFVATKGISDHLAREGVWGALSGTFEVAGAPFAASILFGLLAAALFHPRG